MKTGRNKVSAQGPVAGLVHINRAARFIVLAGALLPAFGSGLRANPPDPDDKVIGRAQIAAAFSRKDTVEVIVNLYEPVAGARADRLRSTSSAAAQRKAIRAAQQEVLDVVLGPGVAIKHRYENIPAFAVEVTEDGLAQFEFLPEVAAIEPVRVLEPHLAQGIPLMGGSSYRSTYTGAGTSIAICDTGVDYTHPRLGGGAFPNGKVLGGYDTGDGDADPMPEDDAHGTACAGIAAGDLGNQGDYIGGVAHDAGIYALKITAGSEGSATSSAMIAAWDWCVTHWNDNPSYPIKVISTSFGGGRHYEGCDTYSPSMTAAANNAIAVGITLLCSSGNDGYCDSMGWPACISSVISVGAVYDANFGTYRPCISSNSCAPMTASAACSTGYYATDATAADRVTSYANVASFLTLHAPANSCYTLDIVGSSGYSDNDYYSSFGGTSAACPYAAGAVACLQEAAVALIGRYLTPGEVKAQLTSTGDAITDTKVAITTPRVNLEQAIDSLAVGGDPFMLPYTERFEAGFGSWVNASGDDGNWTRWSGSTQTGSTGPDGAPDGSFYLYTEASSGQDPGFPNKEVYLDLDLDLAALTSPQLTFWYHMYGADMGTLAVDVYDGTWHSSEWTVSGQQHGSGSATWSQAQVNLDDYGGVSNVTLRIRGRTGTGFLGDMAIDLVTVESSIPLTNTLDVTSAYNASVPPVGSQQYAQGAVVACAVTSTPQVLQTSTSVVSVVCTGWMGTGSVPAWGTGTNVNVTLDEDSAIAWQWQVTDLVLSNQTVTAEASFIARDTISGQDGFVVGEGGEVLFQAGDEIRLRPLFHAQSGSVFRATAGP